MPETQALLETASSQNADLPAEELLVLTNPMGDLCYRLYEVVVVRGE